MKRCPNCSAEYDDNLGFCTKDGRALVTANATRARLCPQCANSIDENAVKCPYCKAEFGTAETPQWPMREEMPSETVASRRHVRLTNRSKAIMAAALIVIVLALGVFLINGYRQRNDSRQLEQANLKQLQEREQKIKTLEGEVKQLRQELDRGKSQVAALAAKYEESQKELSATQQRLATATRDAGRAASKRAPITPGSTARSVKTPPSPTSPARRPAEPGVYEVIRATTVREEPSGSARRITDINKGTKITVVRTVGDWLEVRSKQGNPPGYVRLDDAILVSRAN
jgi:cell division protein FtsL